MIVCPVVCRRGSPREGRGTISCQEFANPCQPVRILQGPFRNTALASTARNVDEQAEHVKTSRRTGRTPLGGSPCCIGIRQNSYAPHSSVRKPVSLILAHLARPPSFSRCRKWAGGGPSFARGVWCEHETARRVASEVFRTIGGSVVFRTPCSTPPVPLLSPRPLRPPRTGPVLFPRRRRRRRQDYAAVIAPPSCRSDHNIHPHGHSGAQGGWPSCEWDRHSAQSTKASHESVRDCRDCDSSRPCADRRLPFHSASTVPHHNLVPWWCRIRCHLHSGAQQALLSAPLGRFYVVVLPLSLL